MTNDTSEKKSPAVEKMIEEDKDAYEGFNDTEQLAVEAVACLQDIHRELFENNVMGRKEIDRGKIDDSLSLALSYIDQMLDYQSQQSEAFKHKKRDLATITRRVFEK